MQKEDLGIFKMTLLEFKGKLFHHTNYLSFTDRPIYGDLDALTLYSIRVLPILGFCSPLKESNMTFHKRYCISNK